jgi:hypothetical protein
MLFVYFRKATLCLSLLEATFVARRFAFPFESRNMTAPVFQLLCATLSSITNPVAFLAHICWFFLVVVIVVVVLRENSWQWWGKLKKKSP